MRYHDTVDKYEDQDDLVGSPTLDCPIRITRFPTMAAVKKKELHISLRQLARQIEQTTALDKSQLPWFKMAIFGNDRDASPSRHSLRSNANVIAVSGIEADYDGEEITPDDARDMLLENDIAGLIYTTPSHSPDAPRWRVFAPFSEELLPHERELHMARLNGVFGGVLDDASFTLSQSYYGGNVIGRPKVKTLLVSGRYVDTAPDLDAKAKWKRGRQKGSANYNGFDEASYIESIIKGESFHPSAIALAGKWASDGVSYIEASQRLRDAFNYVAVVDRDLRWKERVCDLPKILNHVYGKQVEENIAEEKRRIAYFDDVPTAEEQAEIDADIESLVGGKTYTDGLTFLKPSECAATGNRRYVLKRFVAERDIATIVSPPGVGKSLLAPRLGYAVAQGKSIFGMRVRQGRVLYVAAEDEHGMRGRVAALRREHGEADDFALVAGVSDLLTKESQDLKRLRRAVKERRPSLVVIDTLAMAFPGLEENSAEGMGRVVGAARSLTKWGAAVILIHHDTKDGQQRLPRGHSLLNGALDAALHLTKGDGIVRGRLTKNRNGSAEMEIGFAVGIQKMGLDEDSEPIEIGICRELDADDLPQQEAKLKPSSYEAFKIFLTLLEKSEVVSEKEWRDACVNGRIVSISDKPENRVKTFKRAAQDLLRKNRVVLKDGFYSMNGNTRVESFATDCHHQEENDEALV